MQNKATDAKPAVDAVADEKVNTEATKESSDNTKPAVADEKVNAEATKESSDVTKPAVDAVADEKVNAEATKESSDDTKPAVDAVADEKVNAETTKESDKTIGNPITPVPTADKDCDASPPKLKNKTIKRKLQVLDTDSVSPTDESQPKKIMKLDNEIKTA